MAIFNNEEEQTRRENLKYLEDRRVALAERFEKEGFKPERMFFCANTSGSFAALARENNRWTVIVSPAFGDVEGDFRVYRMDELNYDKEEVIIKGEGLNGMFGFGKKPAHGFNLDVQLPDGGVARFEVVGNRTTAMVVTKYKDNPLLKTKRRRGDANVVWDFMPIDPGRMEKLGKELDTYYLA